MSRDVVLRVAPGVGRDQLGRYVPHGVARPALVVPTASALEPGMPEVWADRGIRHFHDLLGMEAQAALIMDRAGADDRFVPLVRGARFVYFSGGNPRYLTETMMGTPFFSRSRASFNGVWPPNCTMTP